MDSNHRSRKTADLQSAPFGHSGIRPKIIEPMEGFEPTTPRLQITCSGQLSYIGRWVSYLHRAATTGYPCCGQTLGDSQGAGRIGLTRAQK